MTEKKQGGKRQGAGRKPAPIKKEYINLFLDSCTIEKCGGRKMLIARCYKVISEWGGVD